MLQIIICPDIGDVRVWWRVAWCVCARPALPSCTSSPSHGEHPAADTSYQSWPAQSCGDSREPGMI